ncbi:hypothetical protein [Herminiimonas fonticola]|uniref:hypothetical protein n=1 Tax=Herminiimonas fonticola TaxID=303380 RepID=UPI003341EA56
MAEHKHLLIWRIKPGSNNEIAKEASLIPSVFWKNFVKLAVYGTAEAAFINFDGWIALK